MITIIVFSKDRACQLELCLRSIKEKFHVDKKILVQYTSTNEDYEIGFQNVAKLYPDTEFIRETNFKETLQETLKKVNTEYVVFFTDDDVFIKGIDCYMYEDKYHCLSLRMNPKINRCYPANNKLIKPPSLIRSFSLSIHERMSWNWTEAEDQHTCWGYPMAINSHIYRSRDIMPLIYQGVYNNVNSLESHLNRNRWFDKPYMLSFTETKVFNVQNNFVQGPRQNEIEYSVEWLNEQFLAGKRISTDNIYGLEPQAAHGKLEYILEDIK